MFFVFIDTQAFRKNAFAFETSAALVALRNAVEERRITVLMTTITEREISRQLASEVTRAFQAVRKSVKTNYLLQLVPIAGIDALRTMNKVDVVDQALQRWESYKTTLAPRMIEFDDVMPSRVMDAHFAETPPFSRNKPDEFRDAFVLAALRDWAEEEDQQVLVVSGDGDHKAACDGDRLKHVATIDEVIAMSRDDEALEQQVRELIATQNEAIKEQLDDIIDDLWIAIAEDPDAETEDHCVECLTLDPKDFVLVDFRDGHIILSGTAMIDISFAATISDYANGTIDEGDWVNLPYYTYKIKTRIETRLAIRVRFGGAPPRPTDVESVTIESPKRVQLSLEDNELKFVVTRDWADDP